MAKMRYALVTGGNRGIGLEVVRQLAQHDFHVYLGARTMARGLEAATRLGQRNVTVVSLDVTSAESTDACREQIARDGGRLDVLVNNAAIHYDTWQDVADASLDTMREAFETNVLGAWRMAQMALRFMRPARYGRIVNVSSEAGSLATMGGGTPSYRTSKAALNALTLVLARELAGTGILVNAICPGWVATDMGGAGGRPVADGARGIVWAAMLPDEGPTGGFFRDGRPLAW
jgi:NAD(P)-dependent dehydrogenase (short-subunit alcohol dehydrogenase family)